MKALILSLVLAALGIAVAGCFVQDQIFGSSRDVYRGRVSFGFEEAAFRPCGSNEQWWVTGSDDAVTELQDKWNALGLDWYHPAYAEIKGDRSGSGEYGHLGAYEREIEVTEVIGVRLLDGDECPWPGERR